MSETSERADDEPSAEAKPEDGGGEAPRPRGKRKKKKAKEPAPIREGVPAFAQRFPRDPELDALIEAFERGNYARVRAEAPALAARTKSGAVRRAADELARRTRPDPLAVMMLLAACLLLAFFSLWYFTHRLDAR
jgi:hypothetical protein